MKKNLLNLLALTLILFVAVSCKKDSGDSGPSFKAYVKVSDVTVQQGSLPAEYEAIKGKSASFTDTQFTIGNVSGTYSYTPGQNNSGGTVTLSPDIYSGGDSQYTVTFSNNTMVWVKNIADASKGITNNVTITFTTQ
jgi:hypothetical protein